ncbi:hypothetical protein [Actinoplanes aureus]|uniref:Uncharacterized protein n=1 Tax=Actinoplanes aureus TaxID=2792083 RepID=A0A931CEE1_9ACTN|nr:hypothetical protein [Actinoplanes aureus]MBG0567079.1 hypothetical protein [Actinoplanes aureus]
MDVKGQPDGTVVVVPTSEEAAALGADLGQMLGMFATALTALAHLRNGSTDDFDRTTWQYFLRELEHNLPLRLDGVRNALIRAHTGAGGTYGELSDAMGVRRSTAQYRRKRITSVPPDQWEEWAVGGAPPTSPTPPRDGAG